MQTRRRLFFSIWMVAAAFCVCALPAKAESNNECQQSCAASSARCHQKADAEYRQCMKYCSPGAAYSMCTKQCGAKQTGTANGCQNAERTCQERCAASSDSGSSYGKKPSLHLRVRPADLALYRVAVWRDEGQD